MRIEEMTHKIEARLVVIREKLKRLQKKEKDLQIALDIFARFEEEDKSRNGE